jgi:guanylate kinase
MNKRIILCGAAASGKDFLRKKLESKNFKYAVSYTTRPPREGEVHGRDYYFIDDNDAAVMIERGEFYEHVMFNGWLYGTSVNQWAQTQDESVYIMTPTAVDGISPEDRKECFIIYTDIHIDIRRKRLESRMMPGDSLERRIQADERDFENFKDYDLRITNPDF